MSDSGGDEREANATEDWRESVKQVTTTERNYYQYMLEHEILTDCTFVVGPEDGETREFKAHKVHIARVSVVFEAMLLRGEMVEAKTGHVRVTDLSPHTFQLLLSSIYGKEPVTTSFEEARDVALAADKYGMKLLFEKSLSSMCDHVTPENVWSSLKFVRLLPHEQLRETCMKVIREDTMKCVTTEDFLQVDEEDVVLLLEQDELNVENELELLAAAMEWARIKSLGRGERGDFESARIVLEPRVLSLVRLLTISPKFFAETFQYITFFTPEEKWAINVCMQTGNCSHLPKFLSASKVPRKQPTSVLYCQRKVLRVLKNFQKSKYPLYSRLYISVKTDVELKLLGFEIASQVLKDFTNLVSTEHSYKEDINIEVYKCGASLLSRVAKEEKIFEFEFAEQVVFNSTISVFFPEPVALDKEHWFQISAWLNESGEYPDAQLEAKVECPDVPVKFEFRTNNQLVGYLNSENDGLIRALIVSL